MSRVLAFMLAPALALLGIMALWLAVLDALISFQDPSPLIEDGDPCCGYPDTWTEVALGGVTAVAIAVIACGLFVAAFWSMRWAVDRVAPSLHIRRPMLVRILWGVWLASVMWWALSWFVIPWG